MRPPCNNLYQCKILWRRSCAGSRMHSLPTLMRFLTMVIGASWFISRWFARTRRLGLKLLSIVHCMALPALTSSTVLTRTTRIPTSTAAASATTPTTSMHCIQLSQINPRCCCLLHRIPLWFFLLHQVTQGMHEFTPMPFGMRQVCTSMFAQKEHCTQLMDFIEIQRTFINVINYLGCKARLPQSV